MKRTPPPVLGLPNIRCTDLLHAHEEFRRELLRLGYRADSIRSQLTAVSHLGLWLEREGLHVTSVDEATIRRFERHRPTCRCPGASQRRSPAVISHVHRFLRFLRGQSNIRRSTRARPVPSPLVEGFLRWMMAHRGAVEATLGAYERHTSALVERLGDDPAAFTARALRSFLERRCRSYAPRTTKKAFTAVRMFLRYLAIEGRCRPGLENALPSGANWSLQPLPRGLTQQEVRRVLAACLPSRVGVRDRAVLLLLARLGLRAGEVANLRFSDLDFETATIRVMGKGRRESLLPLPQDVGDAILQYLREARPKAPGEFVFLRSRAPFVAFSRRSPASAVSCLAAAALERASVRSPKRGAHVFRHTAAGHLLEQGVGLEGVAELLRHRSVTTTGIYTKVDQALLREVVQPWPEEVA